jgi:hypothetical protein
MPLVEAEFTDEKELQRWVTANISLFLPGSFWIDGFPISTTSGKQGIPDGFAFNLKNRSWSVVECELLKHGVWPHIAEQIARFIVAVGNSATRRKIRDRLFEKLLSSSDVDAAVQSLSTSRERLLQQVEVFIEGVEPQLAIFIDETNQDLSDAVEALDTTAEIYRVRKFLVNGAPDYYSPDRNTPVLVSEQEPKSAEGQTELDAIELLGGGIIFQSSGRYKCYKLNDGSIIYFKFSKFHESNNCYWYGIGVRALQLIDESSVTHIAFVMGDSGVAKVPIAEVKSFLQHTSTTLESDGSVRHYHCLISPPPNPKLYIRDDVHAVAIQAYFVAFD